MVSPPRFLWGIVFFGYSLSLSESQHNHYGSRPNIVYVLVDDLGWGNVGFNRADKSTNLEVHTPNLDALATEEGRVLERHYVHPMCTPTRCALYSGRIPQHVGTSLEHPCTNPGIPEQMTTIATKLRKRGYSTHFVGKWDAGMKTPNHIPLGRGFNSALSYFEHGNWMYSFSTWEGSYNRASEIPKCKPEKGCFTDLWYNDGPATELSESGIYEETLFVNRVKETIYNHSAVNNNLPPNRQLPLFLVYATRIAHYPLQPLPEYEVRFSHIEHPHRRAYTAMISHLDDIVGDIATSLKATGLWENTLFVLSSDNGGFVKAAKPCINDTRFQSSTTVCLNGEAGANNYPLKGGKYSFFEGGIRAAGFVSGGMIPDMVRKKPIKGMIHIADWYATFCFLAGIDPYDENAAENKLPPVDSINLWPYIAGTVVESPRKELFVSKNVIMVNQMKLMVGKEMQGAEWAGPFFPNSTNSKADLSRWDQDCQSGCLYNVSQDPSEYNDISETFPEVVKEMWEKLLTLRKTSWSEGSKDTLSKCDKTARTVWNNFVGPFEDLDLLDDPFWGNIQFNFTNLPTASPTHLHGTMVPTIDSGGTELPTSFIDNEDTTVAPSMKPLQKESSGLFSSISGRSIGKALSIAVGIVLILVGLFFLYKESKTNGKIEMEV